MGKMDTHPQLCPRASEIRHSWNALPKRVEARGKNVISLKLSKYKNLFGELCGLPFGLLAKQPAVEPKVFLLMTPTGIKLKYTNMSLPWGRCSGVLVPKSQLGLRCFTCSTFHPPKHVSFVPS